MKNFISVFIVMTLVLFVQACGLSTSTSDSGSQDMADNLETVSNSLVPDSLDYSANLEASLSGGQYLLADTGDTGDPCAQSDDLYDCQPVLLQLYMSLAKDFIDVAKEIVSGSSAAIAEAPDGSSGSSTFEDMTVEYSKTTGSDYSIFLSSGSSPLGYIDVADTEYVIQMDLTAMDETMEGSIDIRVSYTDEDTWSITTFVVGMACDDSDARAPERIELIVNKDSSVWQGKAMIYNGRWLYGVGDSSGDPDCDVSESDELSMNIYTDFVANNLAAKASVYMLSRTVDDLSNIDDYSMDQFAENYSSTDDTDDYTNPFCNPAGTLDALWGDDCTTTDTDVAAMSYSSSSNWVTPYDFYQLEIDLPDSL